MASGRKTGGRQRGTPNKATAEINDALAAVAQRMSAELTDDQIVAMSPLDVMLHAMTYHARLGLWAPAAALAKEAAPYLHRKKAAEGADDPNDDSGTIIIEGGLPSPDAAG